MDSRSVTLQIRKLRKKIRQIENLESLERELTDEEIDKCLKKDGLRDELLSLLSQFKEDEQNHLKLDDDFNNSNCSANTDWSTSTYNTVSENDVSLSVDQSIHDDVNMEPVAADSDIKVQAADEKDDVRNRGEPYQPKDPRATQSSGKSPPVKKDEVKTADIPSSPSKRSKAVNQSKGSGKVQNSKLEFWNTSGFIVSVLEGHNDLVTAVDCNESLFISASRDTTIKVWDFKTLTEKKSFGSHTGSVTAVVLLSSKDLGPLGPKLGLTDDDYLVLSGSVDCSLKLWSVNTGELLKSIYTYNPITKVTFYPALSCAVTASDGGKLELWDLDTSDNIASQKAHDESITGLVVGDGKIFTSCAVVGEIKVYEVRDRQLVCVFVSENVHLLDGKAVSLRHIRALNVRGDNLFYGDDGVNLKNLSWKKGLVTKVANHKEDFGMTDAICINRDTMICSAYDLDIGEGYLNAFDLTNGPSYLTTVTNEDSGRILDICCYGDGKYVTMVTAGTELQVWRQVPNSSENPDFVPCKYEHKLSKCAEDSDLESDVEFSESDSEGGPGGSRRASVQAGNASSWTSWCNLL